MERYLLGIDVGTTGTKTALFSEKGALVAIDYMAYEIFIPDVGCSEQDATHLWKAIVKTTRTVCGDRIIPEQVVAISLSLQGGTLIPVDEDFCPVCNAIVWSDTRCREEAELFEKTFGKTYMYEKTGWELENSLTALQILHLRNKCPEIFAKAKMFLSVADFVAAKMTGIPAVDLSNAGINQLINIRSGTYDKNILDFIGVHENQLAKLVPSGEIIGHLTTAAALELGLTEQSVLIAGAHDQYAVAAGAGCIDPGDVLMGTGTAWAVTAITDKWDFANGFSQSVSAFGSPGSLVSLSGGGICLDWLRRNVINHETYELLNNEVAKRSPGCDGLLFFPYFGGASFPVSNSSARAGFLGLDLSHNRFDMARAVMEGIAFHTVWILEEFQKKNCVDYIKIAGGAAKSEIWCQIIADISNLPVKVPKVADLACVGAALIAGVGCGVYQDAKHGYHKLAVEESTISPNPENVEKYKKCFLDYKNGAQYFNTLYSKFYNNRLEVTR